LLRHPLRERKKITGNKERNERERKKGKKYDWFSILFSTAHHFLARSDKFQSQFNNTLAHS
jgi:hypothetical protein